jgi:hypothetical protein
MTGEDEIVEGVTNRRGCDEPHMLRTSVSDNIKSAQVLRLKQVSGLRWRTCLFE